MTKTRKRRPFQVAEYARLIGKIVCQSRAHEYFDPFDGVKSSKPQLPVEDIETPNTIERCPRPERVIFVLENVPISTQAIVANVSQMLNDGVIGQNVCPRNWCIPC